MSELSSDAKQKVLELKRAYINSFPDKIQQLEICWKKIQSSQFAENELDELRAACHKIAGSSGSYELLDISHAAHELEKLCATEELEDRGPVAELAIEGSFHALIKQMQQQEWLSRGYE